MADQSHNSISQVPDVRSVNNDGGMCTYGLNSQAGYLFERSQNTLRQRSFGRARGLMNTPLKRSREQDSDSDEEAQRVPYGRRAVLDGIKRMRLASPTQSPKNDVDSDMTDEEAVTSRTTWRAKAIVPKAPEAGKKRPLQFAAANILPWKMSRQQFLRNEQPIEIPDDASCRAMVLFDPYKSMTLPVSPRVQLVEDEQSETASESEEENGVRFEELPSDNDEPVDMDVD